MKRVAFILTTLMAMSAVECSASFILLFTSSPTSWVGKGQTRTIAPETGYSILVVRNFDRRAETNGIEIAMTRFSPEFSRWDLYLQGPNRTLATTGFYPDATRYPFNGLGSGLGFSGEAAGNNDLTGEFNVLEATFDTSGQVATYAVDFLQNDEENPTRWVRGWFRYNSSIPLPEPSAIVIGVCAGLGMFLLNRSPARRPALPAVLSRTASASRPLVVFRFFMDATARKTVRKVVQ
jgi:hypothetical protein